LKKITNFSLDKNKIDQHLIYKKRKQYQINNYHLTLIIMLRNARLTSTSWNWSTT